MNEFSKEEKVEYEAWLDSLIHEGCEHRELDKELEDIENV